MTISATAQDEDAIAEMARKAQDPLGNVQAIMTDITIAFDGGEGGDDTSYGFQIQAVYAIENNTSLNIIAGAIVPIVGVDSGVVIPPLGSEERPDKDDKWGLTVAPGYGRGAYGGWPGTHQGGMKADHSLAMGKVLRIVYLAISTHLTQKAGFRLKDASTG
jgi:hypothetical protein